MPRCDASKRRLPIESPMQKPRPSKPRLLLLRSPTKHQFATYLAFGLGSLTGVSSTGRRAPYGHPSRYLAFLAGGHFESKAWFSLKTFFASGFFSSSASMSNISVLHIANRRRVYEFTPGCKTDTSCHTSDANGKSHRHCYNIRNVVSHAPRDQHPSASFHLRPAHRPLAVMSQVLCSAQFWDTPSTAFHPAYCRSLLVSARPTV